MTAPAMPALRAVNQDERMLPHAIEAERMVIGAVLLREEIPAGAEDMDAEQFFLPAHRRIWEAVLELHKHHRKADVIAVADELKRGGGLGALEGGEGYLMTCAGSVITLENIAHYCSIVREKALLRSVIQLCGETISRAYGDLRPDDVFGAHRKAFDKLEGQGDRRGPVRVGDDVEGVLEAIEKRSTAPQESRVLYGISRLDTLLGGCRSENVIVVAARPGMGKSAFATTVLLNNVMRGIPALLFSLEMSRYEVIERILAAEARVNNELLRSGAIAKTEMFRNVFDGARRVGNYPLWIDDRPRLTISQIVSSLRRWYSAILGAVPSEDEEAKPALFAVDYLQIMGAEEHGKGRERRRDQEIGDITGGIKGAAKTLRIPGLALSQLNRAVESRGGPPNLADLRESGAIEQDADVVLFPWREFSSDPEEAAREKNQSGPASLIVGKNRHGRTGVVHAQWIAEYTRFENAIADEPIGHWQDR